MNAGGSVTTKNAGNEQSLPTIFFYTVIDLDITGNECVCAEFGHL